jgi:predicted acyl esterase
MMADHEQGQINRRQLLRGLGFAGLGTAALGTDLASAVLACPVTEMQSKSAARSRSAGADPDPNNEYVDADQRLQGRRTDVLVYQSEILKADMAVAGPVEVSLQVSTTGTDADWVVKLIDVYPPDMPDEWVATSN